MARRFYNRIRTGVAGWSYDDWAGVAYPDPEPRGFDPLGYLSGFLDLIEVNSTFYGPPEPEHATRWARPVSLVVQERRDQSRVARGPDRRVRGIPAGGRGPSCELERPRLLRVARGAWCGIREHRPAAVLPVHRTLRPGHEPDRHIRVHGRNYGDWFRKGAGRNARYDYLYSRDELKRWAERARDVAREDGVDTVDVVFNNHYKAQAVVNALELRAILGDPHVEAPPPLMASYRHRLRALEIPTPRAA